MLESHRRSLIDLERNLCTGVGHHGTIDLQLNCGRVSRNVEFHRLFALAKLHGVSGLLISNPGGEQRIQKARIEDLSSHCFCLARGSLDQWTLNAGDLFHQLAFDFLVGSVGVGCSETFETWISLFDLEEHSALDQSFIGLKIPGFG